MQAPEQLIQRQLNADEKLAEICVLGTDRVESHLVHDCFDLIGIARKQRDPPFGVVQAGGSGNQLFHFPGERSSDIGVPLLSVDYLRKGTCAHEAQDMCASHDSHSMFVFPVNLDGCQSPSYFRSIHSKVVTKLNFDAELLVDQLIRGYDLWRSDGNTA